MKLEDSLLESTGGAGGAHKSGCTIEWNRDPILTTGPNYANGGAHPVLLGPTNERGAGSPLLASIVTVIGDTFDVLGKALAVAPNALGNLPKSVALVI